MSSTILTKSCSKCKQNLPLSEFHKAYTKKGGLKCACKACRNMYDKAYRETDNRKAVQRRYAQSPKGKAVYQQDQRRHPDRYAARHAINNTVRNGKRPPAKDLLCLYCLQPATCWHHHLGYEPEHYLDVVPVCRRCHVREHKTKVAM